NAKDGRERNGEQRGYGKREGRGYPPCCHKGADSQRGGRLSAFPGDTAKEEQDQCQHRNGYTPQQLLEPRLCSLLPKINIKPIAVMPPARFITSDSVAPISITFLELSTPYHSGFINLVAAAQAGIELK